MMKTRYVALIILLFAICLSVSIVYAQESLSTGYRITTDHHGVDVFIGENVVAWADTTDMTVTKVTFNWKWDGSITPKRTINVTTYITWFTGEGGWPEEPAIPHGTEVRRFTDSYTPVDMGDWAVKATFINSFGQNRASNNDSFPVRATSFHVIPEVPLGTVAIVIAMFGSLGFFVIRKKKIPL